jgi:hypothetical protein
MDLKPEFRVPIAPIIPVFDLPRDVKPAAQSLVDNLRDVHSNAESITAAIALYEVSNQQQERGWLFRQWMFLAGEAGAMEIRNYGKALAAVRKLVGQVPQWLGRVDAQALKESEADFKTYFPNADKLRHSVAHPEFYSDPSKNMYGPPPPGMVNSEGGGHQIMMQGSIYNNQFTATFEGVTVSYPLTSETSRNVV